MQTGKWREAGSERGGWERGPLPHGPGCKRYSRLLKGLLTSLECFLTQARMFQLWKTSTHRTRDRCEDANVTPRPVRTRRKQSNSET